MGGRGTAARGGGRVAAGAADASGRAAVGVAVGLAALGLSALGLAACGAEAARRDAAPPAARALAGVWDATFTVDPPPLGFDSTPPRRAPGPRVRGTLALVPNRWLAGVSGLPARPAAYGTYDVDFGPFGFDPREDGRVPDAAAAAVPLAGGKTAGPGDSLVLVLTPAATRVRVWLDGTWLGDSAAGRWRTESVSRAGVEAGGRFVLRRR